MRKLSENRVFTMGRYQPYGHQHHEANVWMAEKLDADVLDIFVDATHGERLPTSPMLGEEIVEAVDEAYESFYETDFEVNVFPRDALSPSFYLEAFKRPVKGFSFVTREESHAENMSKPMPLFKWFGYSVEYWDRNEDPFRESEHHIIESSTEIREKILERDEEWREAVSDPVKDVIDRNYHDIARTIDSESGYYGSKYRDAIASNGMPWSGILEVHDRFLAD